MVQKGVRGILAQEKDGVLDLRAQQKLKRDGEAGQNKGSNRDPLCPAKAYLAFGATS